MFRKFFLLINSDNRQFERQIFFKNYLYKPENSPSDLPFYNDQRK